MINELTSSPDPEVQTVFGHGEYEIINFFQLEDSLRLRPLGNQLLSIYFEHETFKMDRPFTANEIIILSRNLNSPFYINRDKITVYSDEHIVMLKLAGDVSSWLENFT